MKSTSLALPALMLALSACAPVALGTGALVAHSVAQERSTADRIGDGVITVELKRRLFETSVGMLADVGIDVTEGRVVLTGTVPTREDKVTATRLAWETPGVTAVDDQLSVGEDSGARAYIADARISNGLRYALLTDPEVSSINYNVETVDRVVHLTGLARSRAELARVIEHARRMEGARKVVSHVLTIDDPRRFEVAAR